MVYVRCIKLVIFYRAGVQDKWVQIIVSQVLWPLREANFLRGTEAGRFRTNTYISQLPKGKYKIEHLACGIMLFLQISNFLLNQ